MTSSFEKSVKGATKQKLAPPKSKYIEHILIATHGGEAGVLEIFRALHHRLRDSTWTIVFKALIVIHLMIREGEPDVTLNYLSSSPARKMAIHSFVEVQTQGRNIRCYAEYTYQRAVSFAKTKVDYVRANDGRLKRLTVNKGLLRETESVQDQIHALLKCEFLTNDIENEITLTAFRLLTMDLLVLFNAMNEGTINVLEHYFELSHPDAARALDIYRTFVKQTDAVVQYLAVARQYEHATRLEIPKVKHAPLSLAASLEEYLNDRDFETNRKQYLAQQEAKKSGRPTNGVGKPTSLNKPTPSRPAEGTASRQAAALAVTTASPTREEAKGPAPDLIDFFESIEQNQQTLGQVQPGAPHELQQTYTGYNSTPVFTQTVPTNLQQQQQQQQAGAPGLVANPYGQPAQMQGLPNTFSMPIYGNAFAPQSGPFGVQSTPLSTIPQNTAVDFSSTGQQQQQQLQPNFTAPQFSSTFQTQQSQQIQPQSTNPFRHSMMPAHATGTSFDSSQNRLSTNPFAKPSFDPSMPTSSTGSVSYASPSSAHPPLPGFQSPFQAPFQAQPISSSLTGTNPFARPGQDPSHMPLRSALPTGPALATQQTGSTNPFRQSAFVHPQTGQSWQSGPQGTMGGLEQLGTIPVFPRPA